MKTLDKPSLEALKSPTEILLEFAQATPDQCIVVCVVNNQIKIGYKFYSEKYMLAMLNSLEDELKRHVDRIRKGKLKVQV
jgi:hypothetical protein